MFVHLANEFSKNSKSVDLVLAEKKGPYLSMISPQVNVVDLKVKFSNPKVILRLASYLNKARPTSMLSAMTYPNVATILASLLVRKKVRIVLSEHNTLTIQSKLSGNFREYLKPLSAKIFYGRADHIVAVSNGVRQDLIDNIGVSETCVTTIHNPIVTPELCKKYPLPKHPFYSDGKLPIVLGVGRLIPQKDFATLIKAFALVIKHQRARLVILGDGPEKRDLINLAESLGVSDYVSFPGFVNNPLQYMQHSSVFVLSSRQEGFGNVLVEAMVAGCPVISTDCPSGPSEILDNGIYGKLVKVRDTIAIAEAIKEEILSPTSSALLVERAMEFSSNKIAKQYYDVLHI